MSWREEVSKSFYPKTLEAQLTYERDYLREVHMQENEKLFFNFD